MNEHVEFALSYSSLRSFLLSNSSPLLFSTGKLVSIICARFRSHLSRSLAKASASFSHVSSDTRIGPLLKNMNKQYTGRDFGKQTAVEGDMNASNVDEYAERSMPLCMRQVHDGLKKVRRRVGVRSEATLMMPVNVVLSLLLNSNTRSLLSPL